MMGDVMKRTKTPNQRTGSESGVAILMTVLSLSLLAGMLALTFDLARIYLAKNELQTFADAATLAATAELDGAEEGLARARQVGLGFPNTWIFGTEQVPSATVFFASNPAGPWEQYPPSAEQYGYAQVIAQGAIPLYFLPVFQALRSDAETPGGGSVQAAAATGPVGSGSSSGGSAGAASNWSSGVIVGKASAGQLRIETFEQGLMPYSPNAHLGPGEPTVMNPLIGGPDPFNFEVGTQYTFFWPPPGKKKNGTNPNACEDDASMPASFPPNRNASQRGYIDIGVDGTPGSGGSAFIRSAILNGVQSHGVTVGESIVLVPGSRQTEVDAVHERILWDSDSYSQTYEDYVAGGQGNGMRIVYMPVNNPYAGDVVVEFGTFFLPPVGDVCGQGNNESCCAEYVGPGLLNAPHRGAGAVTGVAVTRLIQ